MTYVANIIELVCHSFFILLFFVKCMCFKKGESWVFLGLDLFCIVTGVIGGALHNNEVARYFKAMRTLRMLFFIKEISILAKPVQNLLTALAKVGNILIPALVIIYVYAVVGLYTFSGTLYAIQTSSTTGAGLPTTSTNHQTGQSTKRRYSYAVRNNAPQTTNA